LPKTSRQLIIGNKTIFIQWQLPNSIGKKDYDFDEGILFFTAPGQVFRIEGSDTRQVKHSGWISLIHPDYLWSTWLAKTIKKHEYFDYSVNEALFGYHQLPDNGAKIPELAAHSHRLNWKQIFNPYDKRKSIAQKIY